jgi:hypothetical protein
MAMNRVHRHRPSGSRSMRAGISSPGLECVTLMWKGEREREREREREDR